MHGSISPISLDECNFAGVVPVGAALNLGDLLLQNVGAETTAFILPRKQCRKELFRSCWEIADLGEYLAQAAVAALQSVELYYDIPQAVRDGALGDRLLPNGLVNYYLELLGIADLQGVGLRGVWVVQVAHSQLDTVDFDMEGGVCHRDDGDSSLRYASINSNGSDNL